jgi:hypothetical protein
MTIRVKRLFTNNLHAIILLTYLIIGSKVLPDYGISTDESIQRKHGIISFNYINQKFCLFHNIPKTYNDNLQQYDYRSYGVTFQLFCYILELLLNIKDAHSVFLLRHILTFFLFWLSTVYFYKITEILFKNRFISIVGLLFYILNPRIFSEAFYNPKDIILLSWITIGIYSMIKFLEFKSLKFLLLHSIICALAINSRVVGIVLPFVTILMGILTIKDYNFKTWIITVGKKLIYWGLITLVLTYVLWPFLWEDPIGGFLYSFNEMKRYPWDGQLLYWGKLVLGSNLPWHYTFSQILVTTPILYLIFFITGLLILIINILKCKFRYYQFFGNRVPIIFLLMFALPIFSVIHFNSTLYNGWRQLYFIYPSFLMIALIGLNEIRLSISKIKKILSMQLLKIILHFSIVLSIIITIGFLVKMHPYQYIYYNWIAGNQPLKEFDGDYFGLSYKSGLKFLIEKYPNDTLKINLGNESGVINKLNFYKQDVDRLKFVDNIYDADFYITTYYYPSSFEKYHAYWINEFPFNKKIVFMKKIRGSKFIGIYNLNYNK